MCGFKYYLGSMLHPHRQEALLAAISEKDANIALLELSSSKKKKTQDEVALLKREKDRLVQQLKQQVGSPAVSCSSTRRTSQPIDALQTPIDALQMHFRYRSVCGGRSRIAWSKALIGSYGLRGVDDPCCIPIFDVLQCFIYSLWVLQCEYNEGICHTSQ